MLQTTPGPWEVRGCELVGESTLLATLHWHSGRSSENKADARLIAAAPELYEALEALLSCGFVMSRDKAEAALSKARGEV